MEIHQLKQKAHELGFDHIGIMKADTFPSLAGKKLEVFLEKGYHGSMGWMEERVHHRRSPHGLWEEVRSIISLGVNYGPSTSPLPALKAVTRGNISVYARGDDYHDIIKKRLKALAHWMTSVSPAPLKVFVDTAPVMEKPIAQQAGVGWQGKHTNIVSRQFGSWLFLGEIFTTLDLTPDAPEVNHCGRCEKCLTICPTQAFVAPYVLDARRCVSYLTIEHQGQIPRSLRPLMGNRIYGCDDCLSVCPWNKFAQETPHALLSQREMLALPSLESLASFSDEEFRLHFRKNPIKRIGVVRFTRNVLMAMGNSGEKAYIPLLQEKLCHESPLVRGMAVWALSRLMESDGFMALARHGALEEEDIEVQEEWAAGLSSLG